MMRALHLPKLADGSNRRSPLEFVALKLKLHRSPRLFKVVAAPSSHLLWKSTVWLSRTQRSYLRQNLILPFPSFSTIHPSNTKDLDQGTLLSTPAYLSTAGPSNPSASSARQRVLVDVWKYGCRGPRVSRLSSPVQGLGH
jgi:hypothetical protein